jgi:hypothetical protein
MTDTSDRIPANAISYSEAFKRVFAIKRPDPDELRARVERALADAAAKARAARGGEDPRDLVADDDNYETAVRDDYDQLLEDTAVREVDTWFRDQLANGALTAYQYDPGRGKELEVPVSYWQAPPFLPGDDLEYEPIYFLKSEFEAWLRKARGVSRKGSPRLDHAKRALTEKFGDPIPDNIPKDVSNRQLEQIVYDWCRNQGIKPGDWPSETNIRRAAGRRT